MSDLQILVCFYWASLEQLALGNVEAELGHERSISDLVDQVIRTEPAGVSEQKPWVARIERVVRGNATKAGEIHRWMYDQHSLGHILSRIGFREVCRHSASTSAIPDWGRCYLDRNPDGTARKPNSLYLGAIK